MPESHTEWWYREMRALKGLGSPVKAEGTVMYYTVPRLAVLLKNGKVVFEASDLVDKQATNRIAGTFVRREA